MAMPTMQSEAEKEAEMRKYGITRVPAEYFHIDGFRYTALKDAVAHAKRMNVVTAPV